jgi:amino acid adenylation domain-containing protein
MKIRNIDCFDEIVSNNSDKIAVYHEHEKITFADLQLKSKQLGSKIFSECKSINKPIGVFLPKSIGAVLSDIAITYSGNIYMNIDVNLPVERIVSIFNKIEPILIITNNKFITKIQELNHNIQIVNIDQLDYDGNIDEKVLNDISKKIIDTDPYCIINTSGSTGVPKGVVLNHRSFTDFEVWASETYNFDSNEIIGSLSPIFFDIYSFELWLLVTKGCTLVLIPESLAAFPINILKLLKEYSVTFIFWVPTIMVNISNMDLLSKINTDTLRLIWFAGEVFPTIHFNYWKRHLPNSVFANLYGPIEITLDCLYYTVNREFKDDEPLPIGYACQNTDILILNDEMKQVQVGELGELYVRGTSLAMGYYNDPEKTQAAFVQNPLNRSYPELIYKTGDMVYENEVGEVMFKGRNDTLIKHLGYRIELSEIEYVVINKLKLVDNACVLYNKEKKEIVLIYEYSVDLEVADFRKSMSTILPSYMIPKQYFRVSSMPKNKNGKIDRLKLNEIYLT